MFNIPILICRNIQMLYMLVGFSGEVVIYAFLLGFSSPSHQKEWYEYEKKETILIVLITNTSYKAHLLSCALRCLSKLQEIQSL